MTFRHPRLGRFPYWQTPETVRCFICMDSRQRILEELKIAFQRRDADQLAALLHPDVELHLYSASEPIVGREAALDFYREAFTTRAAFSASAEAEQEGSDSVVMRGRVRWFGSGGGHDQPATWRITFRDGLVASITADGSQSS